MLLSLINEIKRLDMKRVDVYIASLWREGHLIKTINSLLKNEELGTITVACNSYTDEQWKLITDGVSDKRVTLYRTNNEKGSNEKLRFLNNENSNYYIAFADDDLIYPQDYFKLLINGCEKYNALVSLHGRKLKDGVINSYYKDKLYVYMCLGTVNSDIEVDIVGTGVSLFKRNFFNNLHEWYNFAGSCSMDDIYVNYFAKKQGIKRYVLMHKEGYIQHKQQISTDNYVYDTYKNNDKIQTDFINEIFNKI